MDILFDHWPLHLAFLGVVVWAMWPMLREVADIVTELQHSNNQGDDDE
jgi:hypothetical protein